MGETKNPLAAPTFETIRSASGKLGVEPASLRARCRREGERVCDCVVTLLEGGVVAFKFGRRWRVRFKQP